MSPADWIAILAIVLIVGGATAYIIKAKKSGKRCIGCPDSATCHAHNKDGGESHGSCSGSCSGCCGCGQKKKS